MRPRVPWIPWTIAAVAVLVAAVTLWRWQRSTPEGPRSVIRLATTLPVSVVNVPGLTGMPVLSPDGSRMAFVGGPAAQIYLRAMDQLDARALPGTDGAGFLCFSPDGQWISYVAAGTPALLKKVSISGGPPQSLNEMSLNSPPTQAWGADGNILFAIGRGSLARIPSAGGKPETLAAPDPKKGGSFLHGPAVIARR